MNTGKISVRYSKALLELAIENNVANEVNNDVILLFETCDLPEFKFFLESPVITPSQKNKFFSTIFQGKISELSLRFLNLLANNKREAHLKNIARVFLSKYREYKNIKLVGLTTTMSVDQNFQDEIKDVIGKHFNSKVELTQNINTEILGGFILRIDETQYDASIRTKIEKIKKELLQKTI